MSGFFRSGSCQCQTSLFHLVSEIYELETNGLGKCLMFSRQDPTSMGRGFQIHLEKCWPVAIPTGCSWAVLNMLGRGCQGHIGVHSSRCWLGLAFCPSRFSQAGWDWSSLPILFCSLHVHCDFIFIFCRQMDRNREILTNSPFLFAEAALEARPCNCNVYRL